MKLKISALILLFFSYSTTFAQEAEYADFTWDKEPKFEVPEADEEQNVIGVSSHAAVEFIFENNQFVQYDFTHEVVYIAKEAGIEENNKIYLPIKNNIEVIFQKVRVIGSDGKINELDESNIQEGTNEENGYTYRYYAVEGLAVGSFLETTLMLKGPSKHTGVKRNLQTYWYQQDLSFELICPDFMTFSFNSLNGLPEVESDTSYEDKNAWAIRLDSMKGFESEPYVYTQASVQGLVYKLSENLASGSKDISSYGEAANSYYKYLYFELEKSETKAIEKFFKEIGITSKMDNIAKITTFENALKASYAILAYVGEENEGIVALLKNKAGDERSMIKLYANALNMMGIKHEVILTSDRTSLKFDDKYESLNYLTAVLFYLSDEKLYLDPGSRSLRLGYVPWENTANYGLFIKPITIGGVVSGLGKVKMIPALDYSKSQFNHRIKVDMTEDPTAPEIDFTMELSGYHAVPLQTSFTLIADDVKEKLLEDLKGNFTSEKVDAAMVVENAEPHLFGKKPMLWKLKDQFVDFSEDAGSKIIFKVGQLIGEQAEMYHEDERIHDVENDFNRAYYRTIEILLPEGYQTDNLDQLNIDVSTDDKSAIFKSSYTLEGNKLMINIDEYYNRIYYKKDEFESFQKVVNAAADFNKITIFLTKS